MYLSLCSMVFSDMHVHVHEHALPCLALHSVCTPVLFAEQTVNCSLLHGAEIPPFAVILLLTVSAKSSMTCCRCRQWPLPFGNVTHDISGQRSLCYSYHIMIWQTSHQDTSQSNHLNVIS